MSDFNHACVYMTSHPFALLDADYLRPDLRLVGQIQNKKKIAPKLKADRSCGLHSTHHAHRNLWLQQCPFFGFPFSVTLKDRTKEFHANHALHQSENPERGGILQVLNRLTFKTDDLCKNIF